MSEKNTLEQGTIDKLYRHAGTLDLVFSELENLRWLYSQAVDGKISGDEMEEKMGDIAYNLGEMLAETNPNLLKDIDFFKHLYNRQRTY